MLELAYKDIKKVFTTILYMYKNLSRDMIILKKKTQPIKLLEIKITIYEMKNPPTKNNF